MFPSISEPNRDQRRETYYNIRALTNILSKITLFIIIKFKLKWRKSNIEWASKDFWSVFWLLGIHLANKMRSTIFPVRNDKTDFRSYFYVIFLNFRSTFGFFIISSEIYSGNQIRVGKWSRRERKLWKSISFVGTLNYFRERILLIEKNSRISSILIKRLNTARPTLREGRDWGDWVGGRREAMADTGHWTQKPLPKLYLLQCYDTQYKYILLWMGDNYHKFYRYY